MYIVGCHAVSSGGVSVTMDPFLRCICVATGATIVGGGGHFASVVAAWGASATLLDKG